MTQPSRVARTNAAMSEATVAALVSRARAEFGSRGFAAASVERIAADVGLSKGAVYYHFTHKKGLFEAALRACHRDIVGRIETRATASPDGRQAVVDGWPKHFLSIHAGRLGLEPDADFDAIVADHVDTSAEARDDRA